MRQNVESKQITPPFHSDSTVGQRFTSNNHNCPAIAIIGNRNDFQSTSSLLECDDGWRMLPLQCDERTACIIGEMQPDVAVIFLNPPGKDLLNLCGKLKETTTTRHIPLIALSEKSTPETAMEAYSSGCDAYLPGIFFPALPTVCRNLMQLSNRKINTNTHNAITHRSKQTETERILVDKVHSLVLEYIDDPSFTYDLLAERVHMCRTLFYRRFRAASGMTVGAYVTGIKLHMAEELLSDKTLAIAEISERIGFSTQRYFCTFFKRHRGMTPSQFRNNLRH